ncbi:MAG: sugar phosphate isomerase/epimerase family protein [Clostridiaceae bacterium]|nr:sugar phosphate isomerase/epimerase family protein [Clostridiaceae bacterium]
MMKLGLFSLPNPTMTYREAVDYALSMGMDAIEPYCDREFAEPDTDAAHRLAEYAAERNMKICCFSMAVNVAARDNAAEIERLKKYAEVAAALGSPFLHHTLLPDLTHRQERVPFSDLLKRAVRSVREVYDYAEQLGVKCVYEDQGYSFNGCERFERFLEAVDRNVGIVADLGNIYFVGENPAAFVGRFAPLIVHVHAKDYLFKAGSQGNPGARWSMTRDGDFLRDTIMGHGLVPFEQVFRILIRAGYQGTFSLEYNGVEDALPAISQSVENLRRLYENAEKN